MSWWRYISNPRDPERLAALRRRERGFPEDLQVPGQAIGSYTVGCGATHGVMERCNFGCTACYLSSQANRQPPLPFEEVRNQLLQMRDCFGPGGNVQITSGEVTLLPAPDLARIIRAAKELELSPMLMTHGDVLLHDPEYLDCLVREGGLSKLSIHIDITQRGRKAGDCPQSEEGLNRVRSQMAGMLRQCRKRTGRKLKAATTMTVNGQNLSQLDAVLTWFRQNLDSFRMISFQPQAEVGRTRKGVGATAHQVWEALEAHLAMKLNPYPVLFGHPSCTRMALLMAIETPGRQIVVEAVRRENALDQRFMGRFLDSFRGVVVNDRGFVELSAKVLGVLLRQPLWLWWLPAYAVRRSWQERAAIPGLVKALLRGRLRIRPFAVVVHSFMSQAEIRTPIGRARLDACAFKLPVNGRMVSMCEMNASGLREKTYLQKESGIRSQESGRREQDPVASWQSRKHPILKPEA